MITCPTLFIAPTTDIFSQTREEEEKTKREMCYKTNVHIFVVFFFFLFSVVFVSIV